MTVAVYSAGGAERNRSKSARTAVDFAVTADPTEFTAPNGVSGVPLRVLFDAIRSR